MNENERNQGEQEHHEDFQQQEQNQQQGQDRQQQPEGNQQIVTEENEDARLWGMLVHLAGLAAFCFPLGNIILTLIFWELKKHEFDFVDRHGKEAMNFQISMSVYGLVAFALTFACIGFLLLPVVAIIDVVLLLIAAVRAHNGMEYRYPLTFRLIK
jgi:hypothetical protein